jgi:hypothetical protein
MGLQKKAIDDLKKFLLECITKEGVVLGKRRFSLELGMLENALFDEFDHDYSGVFPITDDPDIEELPGVDDDADISELEALK